ncbi:hypothetical protein SAMN05216198_1525 [Halopseudomonas litoralis]|uniref:Uncharacterized protein n=1 Tax=Halopseudomonas litoralis TaxID=797277 RepID=A0A1H1QMF8_9GAMM|nr:hypothetical protein [Halopseudomonas litoralis]SDS24523.1 hypothetical protein SAMN05216198_1525 [Halopseudomonas litoralis]
MSKRIITEQQLSGVNIKNYDEVVLTSSPNDSVGVEIFAVRTLAPFVEPLKEAMPSSRRQLLVVVADPDDVDIQIRVRRAIDLKIM